MEVVASGKVWDCERLKKKFAQFIRFVSLVFIPLYILSFYKFVFEWYRYTLAYFIEEFFFYFFIGIFCNFGFYFITTEKARKYKIFATLAYLPTVLITPFVIGAFFDSWAGTLFYVWPLCVFLYFNPWKKIDEYSI